MPDKVDYLITWAANVAEKAGNNVTTTEILAEVIFKIRKGVSLEKAKKMIKEDYNNEN